MLASRAELSQHTLVTVPVISTESKPRAQPVGEVRGARQKPAVAVFLDGLVFRPDIEIGPQLMAEAAFGKCRNALFAHRRCRDLESDRPIVEAAIVMRHLDPKHAAAGMPHGGGEAVDRRHDIARRGHHRMAHRVVHEGVLQIDHDERGPRRVEIGEAMLGAPALHDTADDLIGDDGAVQFHPLLLRRWVRQQRQGRPAMRA
jgi:hypothetical protein